MDWRRRGTLSGAILSPVSEGLSSLRAPFPHREEGMRAVGTSGVILFPVETQTILSPRYTWLLSWTKKNSLKMNWKE